VRPKVAIPSDGDLAEDVRNSLREDLFVDRFDIAVTVEAGVAYLYGQVDSAFEHRRASGVASRVPGVLDVSSYLTISDPASIAYDPWLDTWFGPPLRASTDATRTATTDTDAQIERQIRDEFWWSPFVELGEVELEVDSGVAILSGTVDSTLDRQAAISNAYEGGALLVRAADLEVDRHERSEG